MDNEVYGGVIPNDMSSSTRNTHITGDMCFRTRETHIPSDMCSPTWETHTTPDMCFCCGMCFPYPLTIPSAHITSLGYMFPRRRNTFH